uniref:Uncharacterized protein n=1 Tax=Zea mays TaxID=4577 RepID=A0A804QAN8_MAIZE
MMDCVLRFACNSSLIILQQDFDVTPRQLEEVSSQMMELYVQNRTPQAQQSQGSEAEGSSAGVRNQHSSVKSEGNSKEPSAHGYHPAFKPSNLHHSSLAGAPGDHDSGHSNSDKHVSGHKMLQNDNGNHVGSKEKNKSGGKSDAGMDRFCHEKSPPGHHYSKVSHESHNPVEEQKPHQSHDNPNERIDGILGGNEVPGVSTSRIDAMNKIDKGKVKAALEKRRKTKGDITTKVDVMDDDDLLERELEHGVELAIEDEKIKQDKMQNLSHIKDKKITQDNMQNLSHIKDEQDNMQNLSDIKDEKIKQDERQNMSHAPVDLQTTDQVMENGHHVEPSVPTTVEDTGFPLDNKEHPPFDKQNDVPEHESQQLEHTLKHDLPQLVGGPEQDDGTDCKRPKLEE